MANVLSTLIDKLQGIAQPARLSMTYDQGRDAGVLGAQQSNWYFGVFLRRTQPVAALAPART